MDVDSWWEAQPAQAAHAAQKQFAALTAHTDPADVAALGMWTDADGSAFVCGVCLESDIRAAVAQMPELGRADIVWDTGEWTRTSYDLPESVTADLDAVVHGMNELRSRIALGEVDYDDPPLLRYMAWQVGAVALAELFDEGFFDAWPNAVQVFQISDESLDPHSQIEWIEMCNTDEAAAAYARYVLGE